MKSRKKNKRKPAKRASAKTPQPGTKPPKRPRVKLPAPVEPVYAGWSGITLTPSTPKDSQVPHDPPMYYPPDLWPQTNVILLEARRKFPLQTQTLELCKHATSEMTPLFCEAVKAGKMKASDVLREDGGGMEDLLHSLLALNDDGPSVSGLSGKAHRLGQEVRKSDKWLVLAEAVADIRSAANQAEASGAQNSEKTKKQRRERGPDYKTIRQRVALEDDLRRELGTIKSRAEKFATIDDLQKEFPTFQLWKILSQIEQQELLAEEFKPTAYARTLVMRQFGLTNPETIKKDRQKLRKGQ